MAQIQLHVADASLPIADGSREIDIVRATADDLRAVSRLLDAYRVFYGRSSNRRAARFFLAERMARGESVIFLARRRDSVAGQTAEVGFAQVYRSFSSVRLGEALILNDLYVIPGARRCGIGGRLIDACTAYARKARAVSLQLETHPDNAAALQLYANRGFTPDNEFARLTLPLALPSAARTVTR